MLDIESFNKALKCSWIKKYLDDENKGKWKLFLDLELECFGGKMFFTYNLSKNDLLNRVHFKDPFLKEVLNIWTEVNFEPQLKSVEHFHSQTLWFNSVFRIAKKTFFYSDWSRRGINQVRDLLKDDLTPFSRTKNLRQNLNSNLRPGSIFVSLGETFRRDGRNEK